MIILACLSSGSTVSASFVCDVLLLCNDAECQTRVTQDAETEQTCLHKQSGADEQLVQHLFVQKHSQNAKKIA